MMRVYWSHQHVEASILFGIVLYVCRKTFYSASKLNLENLQSNLDQYKFTTNSQNNYNWLIFISKHGSEA